MGTRKGEEKVKLPTLSNRTLVRRARGALCSRALRLVLAGTVLVCATAPVVTVQAAAKSKDKREIKAREAFAQGHYEEALDLFAKLYAEKLHPTYLRNIGRCYQNLKMPEAGQGRHGRRAEGSRGLHRRDGGPQEEAGG
jgi:hypothetical protein